MGELVPAGPDNPRGFFESAEVLAAHEALLGAQERDWTCPPHRLDPLACDLAPLAAAAGRLASRRRPWGVKDPRLLFLLPAWAAILPAMRIIGVLRHPAAVAASLSARNGFAPEVARRMADAQVTRLAGLQEALGFPVLDYGALPADLLAAMRAVAESAGLQWNEAAAADLFDPGLRHQKDRGPAGAAYDRLAAAAAQLPALRPYHSWEVAAALAGLPDLEAEPVPLVQGPAFAARRDALWAFANPGSPELGRVLDVVPAGGRRDPLLHGIDRVEADFAVWEDQGRVVGADPSARYTHALLTGVAETCDRAGLTALLAWLGEATASDAVAAFDAFVVEGTTLPPARRWAHLSATTARQGALHHHHLDEIEMAAFDADWLVGEVAFHAEGRSRVRLVKAAARRAAGSLTSSERRAALAEAAEVRRALERERQRNRAAHDALLKENAEIRRLYHERLGALKEEVRRLRRLRTVRGWLAFQVRRLRPGRAADAFERRRASRTG
jgi:hypothetical protein